MATEELELRPKTVEAKAEERTYKEFDEEQNIDDMRVIVWKMLRLNVPPLPSYRRQNLTIRLQ